VANDRRLPAEVLPPGHDQLGPAGTPFPAGTAQFTSGVYDAEYSEIPRRSLRDYLRVLYKYRWLAATCFGLTVGIAVLLTVLTPRLYTAATRLQVSRQGQIQLQLSENVLNVEDSDRNVNGVSSFLATQVAALKSRDLAERVIRGQRLAQNEAFLHPGAERGGLFSVGAGLLTSLRPRGWERNAPSMPERHGEISGDIDPGLLDRYMAYLAVTDVRGTDLIEVRFTTPNPSLAAFLTAAHTQAYMEANDEARLATDVTAKDFLGQQLRESREKVENAEAALRRFGTEHPNVAVNQEQKLVGQKISELTSLLTKAEGNRVTLESRFGFLTEPKADAQSYFLDKPGVQKLHLALLDLKAQRAGLGNRLGPNHPQMIEIGEQEGELARQLTAEVGHEVDAVRARFDAAKGREEALRKKLGHLEESAIGLRDLGARYDLLKNDVDTTAQLHQTLLKQQMETAVNSALVASNIRVIERAEVPKKPSKPNVPMNLMLGVIAGLVFGLGATFVSEHFDNSVKSSEEVEGLLQLPALATIPNFALARRSPAMRAIADHADGNGKIALRKEGRMPPPTQNGFSRDLVVVNEPLSPVAEAFRALRTAVLFSTPDAPPKVILVTSAGASEGKTVSSLNLASALAESGSRVLLIDVDLRKPACHRALGVRNDRGLSSYLAGQADLKSVTHVFTSPKLSFIPAGPTPPNPAELVGSARMRDTLEALRDHYDFLVIDSPPVLPVTDAVVLSREADGVLMVVKGHDTPRELIKRARDQLMQANAHLLGAVVNNVDMGWGDLYFYNRYYGYYRHAAEEHAS
jgi:succinoglycan biosynthesis transport protein ExoP